MTFCFLKSYTQTSDRSFVEEFDFVNGIVQRNNDTITSNIRTPLSEVNVLKSNQQVPIAYRVKNNNEIGLKSSFSRKSSSDNGISNNILFNQNLVPNSPKSLQSLEANLKSSTNLYTGKQNISLPIFSFSSKSLSVPVSLNKTTPNIKPGMKESRVGFGWELISGGKITRKINGLPDEKEGGYFVTRYNRIENAKDLSINQHYEGMKNEWDTSPDEFYFEFNGISGTFMFDAGLVGSMYSSNKSLSIRPVYSNMSDPSQRKIDGFVISDDKGYQYYFGKADGESGENTIGKIATKTQTTEVGSTVSGLLMEINSTGSKIYNFAPFQSAYLYIEELNERVWVTVNDIIAPEGKVWFLTGYESSNDNGASKNYKEDLTLNPTNVEWKLTKIETPFNSLASLDNNTEKDDYIKFEYDEGGWVEYSDVPQRSSYKYNFEGNFENPSEYFRLKIKNPNYQPCYVCPENPSEFFYVDYPGRRIPSRPDAWVQDLNNPQNNYNYMPYYSVKYYTKIYKKTSSLKKITNKYGEFLLFSKSNKRVAGFNPMSTENYGNPYYNYNLLKEIKLFNERGGLISKIADFKIENSNTKSINNIEEIKILDKVYKFIYDSSGYLIDEIIYPTGGSTKFDYENNTVSSVSIISSENNTLIKKYLYKDKVEYNSPTSERKISSDFGLLTVYNSSGVYGKNYSKGQNTVYRTVESYINDELQSIHKFTTPLTHKDEENRAYIRGTDDKRVSKSLHQPPPNFRDFERGIEETKITYGKGDVKKTITNIKNTYEVNSVKGVRLGNFAYNSSPYFQITGGNRTYSFYHHYFPKIKKSKIEQITFYKDGNVEKKTSLTDYEKGYPSKIKSLNSKGDSIFTEIKYPFSFQYSNTESEEVSEYGFPIKILNSANIVQPIEKVAYIKTSDSNIKKTLSAQVTLFTLRHQLPYNHILFNKNQTLESNEVVEDYEPLNIIPVSIGRRGTSYNLLKKDNRLVTKTKNELYDDYGNPIQIVEQKVTPTVYLWGYNHRYVIAKITGATYEQVSTKLSEMGVNMVNLSENKDEMFLLNTFESLRNNMSEVDITSYTYKPLFGLKTVTNASGYTTKYVYDDFGNLKFVKDYNDNILNEYEYYTKTFNR